MAVSIIHCGESTESVIWQYTTERLCLRQMNVFPQKRIIDVSGCMVIPGIIDIHTHLNYKGNASGMMVDLPNLSTGVTAAADAGSTGVSNCAALADALMDCQTKTKFMLNVSASGIIMANQFPESVDPSKWDLGLFDEAFAEYHDRIMALKIRVSKGVVKELGLDPLKKALKLAERYQTRVVVHTTNLPLWGILPPFSGRVIF